MNKALSVPLRSSIIVARLAAACVGLVLSACATANGPASPEAAAGQLRAGATATATAEAGAVTASTPRAAARKDAAAASAASGPSTPSSPLVRPDVHYVLLGEVHDNPAHHQARAALLQRLLDQQPDTVVVMEQMSRDRDAALAQALRQPPVTLDQVLQAGQFDRKAWAWPLHQPVLEVVVTRGVGLRGGNLERDVVRRIVREGDTAWPSDLLDLRNRTPWTDDQQQTLVRDIQDGHCGAMPVSMLPGMVNAQRARDAAMAQALVQARRSGARRVVLIAGNGHVRRDVAVPVYLQAAGVAASDIESIGYLEPSERGETGGRYDRTESAPAPKREDPCAAFKR